LLSSTFRKACATPVCKKPETEDEDEDEEEDRTEEDEDE